MDREGTVFVRLNEALLFRVEGSVKTPVASGEFVILCVPATPEECKAAQCKSSCPSSTSTDLYFALCGDYKIPLVKELPVTKAAERRYTFILPEGLVLEFHFAAPHASNDEIDVLETILARFADYPASVSSPEALPVSPSKPPTSPLPQPTGATATTAEKVGQGITKAGDVVSGGIEKGAEKLNQLLRAGGDKMVANIQPNQTPAHFDAAEMRRLQQAKKVTGAACSVSGKAVHTLLGVTHAVSERLSKTLAPIGRNDSVRIVASSTLHAAGQVMDALADAGKNVVSTTGHEATKVIGHKYGDEARAAARVGAGMATDVVEVGLNVNKITPQHLVVRTGKDAVKMALTNPPENQPQLQQIAQAPKTPPQQSPPGK